MKSLFVCLCIASLAFGGCKSKKDTLQLDETEVYEKWLNLDIENLEWKRGDLDPSRY